MDRTGQTLLGKYELTRLLGRGGMGEVWEGEHAITGRRVAVKVLSDKYLSNRKVVKRFGREARAASAVNHPGIVEILDHDRTPEGVPFLVMEFLDGQSLGERLRDKGKLNQQEALAVMLPLLDALDAAHSHGVIHRDLKPDNIYLPPDSRGQQIVKILDFGISQKADEIDHKLTQEGSVLGTPHYMSPEQARGALGIDARADIYAAGVLFYELVVGDVPFDAGNYNALLQIILSSPPVPPRQRGADISSPVEQVLLATLEKDRERRPSDARSFRDLLAAAAEAPEGAVLDLAAGSFEVPRAQPEPAPVEPEVEPPPPPPVFDDPTEGGALSPREPSIAPPIGVDAAIQAAPDPFGEPGQGGFGELEAPPDLAPLELADAPRRPSPQAPVSFDGRLSGEPSVDGRASPAPSFHGRESPAPAPDLFDPGQQPRKSNAVLDFESTSEGVLEHQSAFSSFAPGAPPPPRASVRHSAGGTSARGAALAERMSQRRPKSRSTILRTLGNWVVALVVIGGVVFLISQMFERDDPRRRRRDAMTDSAD